MNRESQPEGQAGIIGALRILFAGIAAYVAARVRLAGMEGREAAKHLGWLLLLVVVMILLAILGWFFVCLALAFIFATWFGMGWLWVFIAGLAGVHFLGLVLVFYYLKAKTETPLFAQTMEELKKDQEWLDQTTRTNRQ